MRRFAGVVAFAATSACASISGLNEYGVCPDLCGEEASADASVEQDAEAPGHSPGAAIDSGSEPAIIFGSTGDADIARTDAIASPDSPSSDVGQALAVDARTGDAGSPCGPTDTIQNCGACGRSCDSSHSVPTGCDAGTCIYSGCSPGWSDCDRSPPNSNGCECHSGGCCSGGTCQTAHSNGNGQTFYDCAAPATYNATQATEACTAFTGNASQCTIAPAGACGATQGVCSSGATKCLCWQYAGPAVGTMEQVTGPVCPDMCPSGQGTSWN
jgi:hypothetical protein